jgi:hypothetical protein
MAILFAGLGVLLAAASPGWGDAATGLQQNPPMIKTLRVQLAVPHRDSPPPNCEQWPSCADHAPNAHLALTFDEAPSGVQKLAEQMQIDLGGHKLVGIKRDALGIYRGDFCLDTRALCRSQRVSVRGAADETRTVTIFRGRDAVGQEDAPSVDLDALWEGREVSLTSSMAVTTTILPERSLLITGDEVIKDATRTFTPCGNKGGVQNVPQPFGDPNGVWTFGRLMKLLAQSTDAGEFIKSWILQLDPRPATPLNTFPISSRPGLRGAFLVPWCNASGTVGCDQNDDKTLKLTPETAPFRLLAIVNRIDLAEVFLVGPPQSKSAGELRFIFTGHTWNNCASALNFYVILEYEVRKSTCDEFAKWAQSWVELSGMSKDDFVKALAALVESVVVSPPGQVRLRTSEQGFGTNQAGTFPWMMRQFDWQRDDPGTPKPESALVASLLNRTPDVSFQIAPGLSQLKTWITANANDIDFDRHEIPATLPGHGAFAAGEAGMFGDDPAGTGTFWRIPGVDTFAYPDLQHHFSLNTCAACHAAETGTNAVHVRTGGGVFGAVSLSKFLEGGMVVNDPRGQMSGGKLVQRTYDDLSRRKQVLACVANGFNQPCLCQATLQKISMPH